MNERTKAQNVAQPAADHDDTLLALYGFGELPVVFSMRDGNQIINEKTACYRCAADGFYGAGKNGTWYEEGSIVVMDIPPNHHTEPLNRAAGLRWAHWHRSLPLNRVAFDISDMAEASQILAKNPQVQSLSPGDYQGALIKLCEELKLRREGKSAMNLPNLAHNFGPMSGSPNSAPILGAKVAAGARGGPGDLHGDGQRNTGSVRRANAPANIAGGNAIGGPSPV